MVKLLIIVSSFTVLMLSLSVEAVAADVVCPPDEAIAPCRCIEAFLYPGTVVIDCFSVSATDTTANDALDAFVKTPDASSVSYLYLHNNSLTRIPDQVKSFTQLKFVDFWNNKIASIGAGAFNLEDASNPLLTLSLYDNQLTSIAPGAFKGEGYGNGTVINLAKNQLTRFEATVFESVLEKIAPFPNKARIDISGNPIDCSDASICHLAWLLRDKSYLLPAVVGGTCSDGKPFGNFNIDALNDCPSFVCPLGFSGFYADPLSCYGFYYCVGEKPYYKDCTDGEVFNPDLEGCDDIANVPSCQ